MAVAYTLNSQPAHVSVYIFVYVFLFLFTVLRVPFSVLLGLEAPVWLLIGAKEAQKMT